MTGKVVIAGSIAGSGLYYIGGGNTLTVGSNNLSTTVSGVIADNNPCGCTTGSGSLVKVGSGELTLSGINTYTGTTAVSGGFLSAVLPFRVVAFTRSDNAASRRVAVESTGIERFAAAVVDVSMG